MVTDTFIILAIHSHMDMLTHPIHRVIHSFITHFHDEFFIQTVIYSCIHEFIHAVVHSLMLMVFQQTYVDHLPWLKWISMLADRE